METPQNVGFFSSVKVAIMVAVGMVLVFLGLSKVHQNSEMSQAYTTLDGVAHADAPASGDSASCVSTGDSGCGDGC